ncbi:MAG: hypothetical protein IKB34_07175 [Clostridia bacterium]|nr:hypothetical protein [Clostridia bacterium]
MDKGYIRRIKTGYLALSCVIAFLVIPEVLLRIAYAVGMNTPEGMVSAVILHIFELKGYRLALCLLCVLLIAVFFRLASVTGEKPNCRYAVGALGIKTLVGLVGDLSALARQILGIGAADQITSSDGYLIRMIFPTVSVITDVLDLLFAVAFICAFLATFRELTASNGSQQTDRKIS